MGWQSILVSVSRLSGVKVGQTLTLSPKFCALKMTLRMPFTHSSRLGTESASKEIVRSWVRSLKPFSPCGSHDMAYRRLMTP